VRQAVLQERSPEVCFAQVNPIPCSGGLLTAASVKEDTSLSAGVDRRRAGLFEQPWQ